MHRSKGGVLVAAHEAYIRHDLNASSFRIALPHDEMKPGSSCCSRVAACVPTGVTELHGSNRSEPSVSSAHDESVYAKAFKMSVVGNLESAKYLECRAWQMRKAPDCSLWNGSTEADEREGACRTEGRKESPREQPMKEAPWPRLDVST